MEEPLLVTVVIPAFNRPRRLLRAIHSVLSQQESRFELIVVDDGSTADLTAARRLVENAGHQFLRQSRGGPAKARNRGADAGSAPWIAFLDSDDLWKPDKLSTQIAFHQANPTFLLSQTAEAWIRNGRLVKQPSHYQHRSGHIFPECLQRCCISCSSVIISRPCFEEAGGFNTLYTVCEDYDLWLRLTHQLPVGWIPSELTVKHGGHEDQLSKTVSAMDRFRVHALLSRWQALREHRPLLENAIREKTTILLTGAQKRGLPTDVYCACLRWLKTTASLDQAEASVHSLCVQFRQGMVHPSELTNLQSGLADATPP
jgi:glycosyltransferase involved in cell wall biosynthesis